MNRAGRILIPLLIGLVSMAIVSWRGFERARTLQRTAALEANDVRSGHRFAFECCD